MVDIKRCKVCREPERRRLIEADYEGGLTPAAIARRMVAAGWDITSPTVVSHLKEHYIKMPPSSIAKNKRDASVIIRDAQLDALDTRERDFEIRRQLLRSDGVDEAAIMELYPPFDILNKDLQPALKTALMAQKNIDSKEIKQNNQKIDLYRLMLGGPEGNLMLAPKHLLGDGSTIEGDFEELDEETEA